MNRYFYIIEEHDGEGKHIHMIGNVYHNNAKDSDTCFEHAEWTWLFLDIDEAKHMYDTDVFFDYIGERVKYIQDLTEEQALEVVENYFGGNPGTDLHIVDITEDTPCGEYWFEQVW